MSGPLVLGPNPAEARMRRVVIALPDWGDAAVWLANLPPEAGTVLADLTTDQPSDFVGFDVSGNDLVLAGGNDELPLDVVAVVLANATTAATITVEVGNSLAEAAGNEVHDSSGNGAVGTPQGSPTFVAGKYEGALLFDQTIAQHLRAANVSAVQWTWMAWVNLTSLPGSSMTLMYQPGQDASTVSIIRLLGVGLTGLLLFDDGRGNDFASTSPLVPAVPSHVAITYDDASNIVTLYLDGEVVGTGTAAIYAPDDTYQAPYLAGDGSTESLDGWLDDVRWYTSPLSQAQIQAEMQSEVVTVTDTIGYQYKLNGYRSGVIPFGQTPNAAPEPGGDDRRSSFLLLPYRMHAQEVRLTISDPTNVLPLRIGRIFVGPGDQPARQNYSEGYSLTLQDDSKNTRTPSGQTMVDSRPTVPGLDFALENVSRAELLAVWRRKYLRRVGTSQPLLVCLDPEADDDQEALTCYGLLTDLSPLSPQYYDGWRVRFVVEALI